MSRTILIQPVLASMAPTLTELHAESFGVECWNLAQMEGSLELATTRAWAASEGDAVTGFILCQIIPKQIEILTFCVSPTRRQQGIGAALLRRAIAAMREQSGGKVFLEVAADNNAARKLYEDHGFTIIGKRANYYKRGAVTVDGLMYAVRVDI